MQNTDILVVGGGVAGLTATAAFADAGYDVICVDKAPESAGAHDTRTTAFLGPAVDLLQKIGVWSRLSAEVAPLSTMRLIDAGGVVNEARETADFDADELGQRGFGWNAPNLAIRTALRGRLADMANAALHYEVGLESLVQRRDYVIATLSDGQIIQARLIVGADGRESLVRKLSGIGAKRWSYGQKALVFSVNHDQPHLGVSTEIHRTGGPFTLVPMPDGDGSYRSSIVWMDTAAETMRRADLMVTEFSHEMNERSLGVLGRLTDPTPRAAWPIISLLADRITAPRVALIAEAAHVVPPIGAQGLNMSLGDIATLISAADGGDPGDAKSLATYQRRWPELAARVGGIDALNRAALAGAQPARDLRRFGLSLIASTPPLRHTAMRLGLGLGK
ncbi:MAG: FAD-dependent monooxygenase [Pikeienuella sp.]